MDYHEIRYLNIHVSLRTTLVTPQLFLWRDHYVQYFGLQPKSGKTNDTAMSLSCTLYSVLLKGALWSFCVGLEASGLCLRTLFLNCHQLLLFSVSRVERVTEKHRTEQISQRLVKETERRVSVFTFHSHMGNKKVVNACKLLQTVPQHSFNYCEVSEHGKHTYLLLFSYTSACQHCSCEHFSMLTIAFSLKCHCAYSFTDTEDIGCLAALSAEYKI